MLNKIKDLESIIFWLALSGAIVVEGVVSRILM